MKNTQTIQLSTAPKHSTPEELLDLISENNLELETLSFDEDSEPHALVTSPPFSLRGFQWQKWVRGWFSDLEKTKKKIKIFVGAVSPYLLAELGFGPEESGIVTELVLALIVFASSQPFLDFLDFFILENITQTEHGE